MPRKLPPPLPLAPAPQSNGSAPAPNAVAGPSRRTQPARARRGGPGVGSMPIDELILDALNRQHDADPVVPARTRLLLTTDARAAAGARVANGAGGKERESHFARPEVVEKARAQREIETPEFWQLPEHASVGGRFRARASEGEAADTSDAAYEKRHRKYETFEKRQRLREKEKLKHEHYKLKERIEQLRAMDAAAFAAADASLFKAGPAAGKGAGEGEPADAAEGARRKSLFLAVATALEGRYATLLDPGAHRAFESAALTNGVALSLLRSDDEDEEGDEGGAEESGEDENEAGDEDEEAGDEDEELADGAADEDAEEDVDIDLEDPEPPPAPAPKANPKLRIRLPPRASLSASNTPRPTPRPPSPGQNTYSASAPPARKPAAASARPKRASVAGSARAPSPPAKRARVSSMSARTGTDGSEPSSPVLGRERERDWRQSGLYVAAVRYAPALAAKKPQRHLVAFGGRMPEMPEQEFEVPVWAWPESVPWEWVEEEEQEEDGEQDGEDGEDGEEMEEDAPEEDEEVQDEDEEVQDENEEAQEEDDDDIEIVDAPAPAASGGRVLRHRPNS